MSYISIVRESIMKYADVIGEDLAEMIIMDIAEGFDDLESEGEEE